MSGKRPSLADSMKASAQVPEAVAASPAVPSMPTPAQATAPERAQLSPTAKPLGFYAATRAGKKKITAAVDPAMHKQIKGLALAQDTTTEALLLEAIADLFIKHGVKRST